MAIPVFSTIGFLVLTGFTFVLYGGGMLHSYQDGAVVPTVLIGIWIVGLVVGFGREALLVRKIPAADGREDGGAAEGYTDLLTILAVVVGAVAAFWISIELEHGPVIASALVGILAAALVPSYGAATFCGSFVGMASSVVFDYSMIAIAGLVSGIVFVLAGKVFNGFGGKLGTTAWSGSIVVAFLFGRPLLTYPVLDWDVGRLLVVYCVLGAVATWYISVTLGRGPVLASGVVGLVGGLLLPSLHGPEVGQILAVGVFCASFAGMSGPDRMDRLYWMVPAGILCAVILVYERPFLCGGGGKLGTAAFGSVIGLSGLRYMISTIYRKGRQREKEREYG
jgi:hypothetical protein